MTIIIIKSMEITQTEINTKKKQGVILLFGKRRK